MDSYYTTTGAKAPYPSSRPVTPSRLEPSEGSSSVHTTSQRIQPSPLFSAITRPTVYADQYSWEYPSRDSIGSQHYSGTVVENTFGQPRPLAYPYNTFMSDIRSTEQQSFNMPDHNEYVEPIIARSRREQGFLRPLPYPLHGQDIDGHSVNAINGNHSSIIRQPTADFLRLDHPLPAPPIQEYDLDQDLPVIEPDSYLYEDFNKEHELQHANAQYQQSSVVAPKRHSTTANVKAHPTLEMRPKYKRSQSELIFPSHLPTLTYEPTMSEHHNTPVRVPAIGVDMYQPALGGLQRVSGMQRSGSKRDRVKRFVSGLNPFRRQRKFGRQQRG